MNQSVFIIRENFFNNPIDGQNTIEGMIKDKCNSERLALVYDPIASEFFLHVALHDRDLLEKILESFYDDWENDSNVQPLSWYQLDEFATNRVTMLSSLIYDIQDNFGRYLMGCIPLLNYSPHMFLYFIMTSHDSEDIYLLIDGRYYMKKLQGLIAAYNEQKSGDEKKQYLKIPDCKSFKLS